MKSLFALYPQLSSCPLALVSWNDGCGRVRWRLVDWVGVVCGTPSLLSFGLTCGGAIFEDLRQAGEFAVNIPDDATLCRLKQAGVLDAAGEAPSAAGLTFVAGTSTHGPCLDDCPVVFECQIHEMRRDFERTLVTGAVASARVGDHVYRRESQFDLCRLRPFASHWFDKEKSRENQVS